MSQELNETELAIKATYEKYHLSSPSFRNQARVKIAHIIEQGALSDLPARQKIIDQYLITNDEYQQE